MEGGTEKLKETKSKGNSSFCNFPTHITDTTGVKTQDRGLSQLFGKYTFSMPCCTPSPPTSRSWWIPGTAPILSTSSKNTIPAKTIHS